MSVPRLIKGLRYLTARRYSGAKLLSFQSLGISWPRHYGESHLGPLGWLHRRHALGSDGHGETPEVAVVAFKRGCTAPWKDSCLNPSRISLPAPRRVQRLVRSYEPAMSNSSASSAVT